MKFVLLLISLFVFQTGFSQPSGLLAGQPAPDFTANSVTGISFSLYGLLEQGPVVLNFYRGEWCPYCTKNMNDLSDSLGLITGLGATVISVSPEKEEFAQIKKSGDKLLILSDRNNQIMDLFKVTWKVGFLKKLFHTLHGENLKKRNASGESYLPVPATYIIGPDRKIFARHFEPGNISERMTVKEICFYLEQIKLKK